MICSSTLWEAHFHTTRKKHKVVKAITFCAIHLAGALLLAIQLNQENYQTFQALAFFSFCFFAPALVAANTFQSTFGAIGKAVAIDWVCIR
ncbi:uncharacterized protein LACBIDRAFT_318218 [Laccaria bicolor S238N-H82]|uniref:Predicted protein n=1 Tax=Laccaria bicolor (strain S238N-H82 / ATCC MYA-4686) TaxID=486041 RepID=B0D681_LACBS|nr:uncharacterized protein LACBIDRAFT_318218 [Laccaria bicolor S238N-H82]EDR09895.1 predicted protein [Laccaria bicolor S238N-H82]|eukprot:XP_001879280.1 predicted protein [Laccaria bicolor S238N-H82]